MAAGQAGAWLVPAFGWQTIFWAGGIPCVIVTALLLRLPESPRWLISQGRLAEAEAIILKIESAGQVPTRQGQASMPARDVRVQQETRPTKWRETLSSFYRRRTLVVWALWACAYFVSNSLNNWLPTLYSSVYHLPLRQSLRAASMTNIAQVCLLLVCAFSIDRIGRRGWTVASFIAGAALLGALGFSAEHNAVAVMILGTLSYGVVGSANAVLYLYTPEVYPTRMRAIGTGLATSWLRLASMVGPALVGWMVAGGGINGVFLMFAAVSIAGALAATQMIETRGQALERIAP